MTVDMVNHPPHYNAYSVEVIEVTRHCSFDIGNAIKYMLRHLHKGTSKQDLEKALWYMNDYITKARWGKRLVLNKEAQEKLLVLVDEYAGQDDSLPEVGAALALIAIDDIHLALTSLRSALDILS